jgi:hypothetical protein
MQQYVNYSEYCCCVEKRIFRDVRPRKYIIYCCGFEAATGCVGMPSTKDSLEGLLTQQPHSASNAAACPIFRAKTRRPPAVPPPEIYCMHFQEDNTETVRKTLPPVASLYRKIRHLMIEHSFLLTKLKLRYETMDSKHIFAFR